jgi:hypothetical protein
LKKQNSPYTLQERSLDMGKSIIKQKNRFCGLDRGPKSSRNVLHIVDLCVVDCYDVPISEKMIVQNAVENNCTNTSSVIFINNETNI